MDAKGDFAEAIRILNSTQHPRNISHERPGPKELQRSPQSQSSDSTTPGGFRNSGMDPKQLYGQPSPTTGNGHPHAPAPPQYHQSPPPYYPAPAPFPTSPSYFPPHPGYILPQQQLPQPMLPHPDPPTSVMQDVLYHRSVEPMPPPPPNTIWTPHRADEGAWGAVPMYELPPPDLTDYDMSILVAVRTLPISDINKEREHWNEVRRNRHAAVRGDVGQRDNCRVM